MSILQRFGALLYKVLDVLGWTGKICGVTSPSKINGIPVANISKINGVA